MVLQEFVLSGSTAILELLLHLIKRVQQLNKQKVEETERYEFDRERTHVRCTWMGLVNHNKLNSLCDKSINT